MIFGRVVGGWWVYIYVYTHIYIYKFEEEGVLETGTDESDESTTRDVPLISFVNITPVGFNFFLITNYLISSLRVVIKPFN